MTGQSNKAIPKIRFTGFEGEWEDRSFGDDIISIQTGTNLLGSRSNKGKPLLKMGNIQRGYYSFENLEYLAEGVEVEPENVANYGDFLFNTRNTLELVGKGATWMGESGTFAFNSNLARFKFRGIDTIFYNYLYNTHSLLKQVKGRAMGTTSVAAVYPRSLNSLQYILPQPPEQTKIGSFFKELDRLIELHQQKNDKLVALKHAMLRKMFPQDGETTPEIRFKGFSDNWDTLRVSKICVETYGGGTPKTSVSEFWDGETPWIQSSDLREGKFFNVDPKKWINESALRKTAAKLIPKDSIAVVTRVGFGKLALVGFDYATSQDFLSLSKLKIDKKFAVVALSVLLQRKLNETQGTSIKGITKDDLLAYSFSIPRNDEEQQRIGNYFVGLDRLISAHSMQLTKLKQIKSACLNKMFV